MEPDLPFELTLASTGRRLESLHAQMRAAVLDGRLAAGTPLPSSRALAAQLGLGRNTVAAAYARLVAEGYVQPRERARAVVADLRPAQRKAAAAPARSPLGLLQPLWLQPGMAWHPPPAWPERSFRLGMPEHRWFPHATWRRLTARHQRATARSPFAYAPPDGLPALRQAIAGHVAFARAVACSADDVVVTQGPLSPWLQVLDAQAGLHLAARLRHPGLAAAMAHSLRRHVPGAQWLADYAHPDAAGAAAPGVVFGYGAIDADAIGPALQSWRRALQRSCPVPT